MFGGLAGAPLVSISAPAHAGPHAPAHAGPHAPNKQESRPF